MKSPLPFGYYWEMVHDRSGDIVGDGFCRDTPPQLPPRSGYSYRVVRLYSSANQELPCLPFKPLASATRALARA
jgi:hypothetical protein